MSMFDNKNERRNLNIKMKTMGGEIWWEDIRSERGYRVQRHQLAGHCRILDPQDVRLANGKEAAMLAEFERIMRGETDRASSQRGQTMGGDYFWTTVAERGQYRLQRHDALRQHYRILDLRNVRVASGNEDKMIQRFHELTYGDTAMEVPQLGDVIGVKRAGILYDHYGVYENNNSVIEFSAAGGDFGKPVIHRTTLSQFIGNSKQCFYLVFPEHFGLPGKVYFSPNVPVIERPKQGMLKQLRAFADSINFDAVKYVDNFADAIEAGEQYHLFTPQETVARAVSCIGKTYFGNQSEGGYGLIHNNCEHFAIWCKTGVRMSQQAEGKYFRMMRHLGAIADAQ